MALNFVWYSYLENLEYASDQTWSKWMNILGINICVQTVGAIVAALLVVNQVTSNYSVCWNIMNFLYIRQLVYIFLNFGVIGFQMYSLKNMINKYI